MLTAALFITDKTWTTSKCTSIEKWTWKIVCILGKLYSHLKKEEIVPFVKTQMDPEGIVLMNQTEED